MCGSSWQGQKKCMNLLKDFAKFATLSGLFQSLKTNPHSATININFVGVKGDL